MRKVYLFALVLILSISFIFAQNCPPSLPKTYSGEVSYNGGALSGTYEIRAVLDEDTIGIGEVSEGEYLVDVMPCSGSTGEIYFYINGIETNERGLYSGEDDWGVSEELNLEVEEMPPAQNTCGDGLIQSGEECDGTNLAGRSVNGCEPSGWEGTISCNSQCKIDYSNCVYSDDNGDEKDDDDDKDNDKDSKKKNLISDENKEIIKEKIDNTISAISEKVGSITGATIGFVKTGNGIIAISSGLVTLVAFVFLVVLLKKMKK
ncbi:MAG: hypothetical protein KJ949_00045 [Nanoarchaeota archaeon]|nr:hypothetical protein [Nanoarchaeota archaeon]